jgi:catechol 2,3-dioxygenase-like lactoylglutathione lyase family enzyme
MPNWFTRPVLHVADVAASRRLYVDRLAFTNPWRHEEDGNLVVAQVDRQGSAIILSSQWPDKVGKGLIFISPDIAAGARESAVEALGALRAELEANGVSVKDGSWGYRLLVVDDPDGNQLYFNDPSEPA